MTSWVGLINFAAELRLTSHYVMMRNMTNLIALLVVFV